MSFVTPKMTASDSRRGLLSSLRTVQDTPSTMDDRHFASPGLGQSRIREGSMGNSTDIYGQREPRRRGSVLQEHYDSETDLDRDQILQPDYSRTQRISSLLDTNPMLHMYSDNISNSTPIASIAKTPFLSPTSPPHAKMQADESATQRDQQADDEEVIIRPPPSVHDPIVVAERMKAEALLRSTHKRLGLTSRKPSGLVANDFADQLEHTMMDSALMHNSLKEIFKVQLEIADMHTRMEGIHSSEKEEIVESKSADSHHEMNSGSSLQGMTPSPLRNDLKPVGESVTPTGDSKREQGQRTQSGEKEKKGDLVQLDQIVDRLSHLSTLLHDFHALPNPKLDSAFPPSPHDQDIFKTPT